MLCFLVFLVLLSPGSCIRGEEDANASRGYRNILVEGLPGAAKERVLGKLESLDAKQLKTLHKIFCAEEMRTADGAGAVDAMAVLMEQGHKLKRETGKWKEDEVDVIATEASGRFMEHVRTLESVSGEQGSPPAYPDRAACLRGLGLWYSDNGHPVDYESSELFKEAIPYVLLSDDNDLNKELRATLLLSRTGRSQSAVLREYWREQPAIRQLRVYRNTLRDELGDLAILQPIVFDMRCTKARSCKEKDYLEELVIYSESLIAPDPPLTFIPEDSAESLFPDFVEVLRKMTGRAAVENLGLDKWKLLPFLQAGSELAMELVAKVATFGFDTLGHPDYVILDPEVEETWEVLESQVCALLGSKCVAFVESRPYFPHDRIAGYITGQYATLTQYVQQYETAITEILQRLLRMDFFSWIMAMPESGLLEDLEVDTLWKLFAFLEGNRQYGGLFGALIVWGAGEQTNSIRELEPAGLDVLFQEIISDPDKERRHERLNSITEHLIAEDLEGGHPYFQSRFALVRERCRGDLSTIFKNSTDVWRSLEEHILSIPAEANETDGFYDLQVALVVKRMRDFYEPDVSDADVEAFEKMMREYSTRQLAKIYESDCEVYLLFKHSQLRAFAPDVFKFEQSVDETGIFVLLSKAYRHAHSDRESIFGLILDSLGQGSRFTEPFQMFYRPISDALWTLSYDQDLLGDPDGFWLEVEKRVYADCDREDQLDLVMQLGPKLTTAPLLAEDGNDYTPYETFGELMTDMVRRGEIQQSHGEQPVPGPSDQAEAA